MQRILVTNDDGVHSGGIKALADALSPLAEIYVVAPMTEASASSHSLTLRRPLRINNFSKNWFEVDGTPTDCVNLAVSHILNGLPDLVVSGINEGSNLGDDVTYSGTVAGALEGLLLGIPSLAISQERSDSKIDFSQAAIMARELSELVLLNGLPPRTFLNINVPSKKALGVKVTIQSRRNHKASVVKCFDPHQKPYYWIDEAILDWEEHDQSDYKVLKDGWISVTPLQSDWTAQKSIPLVEDLALRIKLS